MCHDVTAPDHDISFAAADAAMEQAKEAALKIKHFHVIMKKPGTAQLPRRRVRPVRDLHSYCSARDLV